jgi:LEA14-like dessication related protein
MPYDCAGRFAAPQGRRARAAQAPSGEDATRLRAQGEAWAPANYHISHLPYGEASTTRWDIYQTVRCPPHGEASTTRWGIYHTVRHISHGEASTTRWGLYHTVRHLPHGEASTTRWDIYHTVRHLPHGETSPTRWDIYHTVRHLPHGSLEVLYLLHGAVGEEASATTW